MGSREKPEISVVIPTCDRPEYLLRALKSVGTESRVQIIVVDNGNVSVQSLVEGMASVTYIRTAPRIGPSKARNVGAAASEASYIAFLDDDDVWWASYLEHSLNKIRDEQADVVVGELKRMRVGGELSPYKLFPNAPDEQRAVFYKNPGFGGQNFMIKRDVFESIGGFDDGFPASVDRDLAARLLLANHKIVVEPKSVAVLIDHEGGRVRENQVRGNFLFIRKHWGVMRWGERYRVLRTFLRRWLRLNMGV